MTARHKNFVVVNGTTLESWTTPMVIQPNQSEAARIRKQRMENLGRRCANYHCFSFVQRAMCPTLPGNLQIRQRAVTPPIEYGLEKLRRTMKPTQVRNLRIGAQEGGSQKTLARSDAQLGQLGDFRS